MKTARELEAERVARRERQAAERSTAVNQAEKTLRSILRDANGVHAALDFRAMRVAPALPTFEPRELAAPAAPPEIETFLPSPLRFWEKLWLGAIERHQARVDDATVQFREAMSKYDADELSRQKRLIELRTSHRARCNAAKAQADQKNAEIASFEAAYTSCDRTAVIKYFTLVFQRDDLPRPLPQSSRVTYDADSKQLVIERQLPTMSALPAEASFRYVRKTDQIVPVARKSADLRSSYSDVLAQVALRSLRIALRADTAKSVDVFVFNGYVKTLDPRTGTNVQPTLISVTATRENLQSISFDLVEPAACLRGLKALISRNAHELEPVRPLVVFDMVDRRFVDKTDVLSGLDSRPNLAELSPGEFESLMTNLFEKMGLETRLTQASRDGGVDCVAWDMRPIIGGKVVIQAKRYRHTVGVSAVRDLYGTMMNEGAAKGILVTTSGYGDTAYEFAKNKPIELITGSNLLSMLEEYAQTKARIEFPVEWVDGVEWS